MSPGDSDDQSAEESPPPIDDGSESAAPASVTGAEVSHTDQSAESESTLASSDPSGDMGDEHWMTSGDGHPRRWAILGVLVVTLLVVVLDNTVLNIALPTIQEDLDASQSQLVWAVDSYILVFAALLFTWGVLGDKFGRKRILVIGLLIFGIASAASAFAASPEVLIGTRAIMGIGGAAVMPATLAIITVVFPPHERGKAIGAWAGSVGAAVALGPVLGGLLLEHPGWSSWFTNNDWGSVFLINVPIVILGLIGIFRVVPESRNPEPQSLDIPGLLLSFVGLVSLIYGIIYASSVKSWLDPGVIVPMVFGVVLIALFLIYESRSEHKSFDVGLFKNRGYAVSLTSVSLAFFALSGLTFSLPFYFQTLRGMSTLEAGLSFLPFAVGQLIAAPRSGRLVEQFGYRKVMTTGLALVSVALVGMTQIQISSSIWIVLTGFFLFGTGMGLVIAPATSLMQNTLPLARAGAGSAVQNTVRQVFGALGIAIVGTILGTQYARNLPPVTEPLGPEFPTEAAEESVIATDAILTGEEQQGLPADAIDLVREGAFDVFLDAAHLTMSLCAVMVIIAFFLVLFALPHIRPPREGDLAPEDTWDESQKGTDAAVLAEQGLPTTDDVDLGPAEPNAAGPTN
jgi:DHA2 family multidrug resistance protein-like MFS transporter